MLHTLSQHKGAKNCSSSHGHQRFFLTNPEEEINMFMAQYTKQFWFLLLTTVTQAKRLVVDSGSMCTDQLVSGY